MRRLLVVNALIFAVLAAAVALAYYSYSYSSGVTSKERELQLMRDLAEEKVLNIESWFVQESDTALFREVQLDDLSKLKELADASQMRSVFVLDDQMKLVAGGYVTRRNPKEGNEFRDWFTSKVLEHLALKAQKLNQRGHVYGANGWNGKPFVFSFIRRQAGDRTFYIVIEDDLDRLVGWLFPQFFSSSERSKRLYEVVNERGEHIYGTQFLETSGELVVAWPFVDTVDGWVLRVAERDLEFQDQLAKRRVLDSVLIGGAVLVILASLGFLAIAIRRERRANELKSDFISNVSHELKTPLSIISMFGEMLANGRTKNTEQATEYAEIIWRESVRLGRLIDNVLDFAKIERGMGVYEFDDADVGEVVTRAIELVGRRLAAAEMTINAELEPDLPPIRLDANAFTLAVMNLIDNAIKYATEGKKIEVRLKRDGARILLTVRDWGPGIHPEEQEQIFERFYRARAVRLKPIRGSGIGLALVQHIARAHGGDVSVDSASGQGATFQIWLPI
ncbi:MAG: integral rane sensor signal transduction histidine kinase [Myxococcales bacterium]|nr:integral rane sensor signal transduction histidine kinase [Myxococcales bacterium]